MYTVTIYHIPTEQTIFTEICPTIEAACALREEKIAAGKKLGGMVEKNA